MKATTAWHCALTAATLFTPLVHSIGLSLTVDNTTSIKAAASLAATGLMNLYVNNATGTDALHVGTFDKPIYWWEAGAVWGGLVDYWAYTGDARFVATTAQALLAQKGPANDFMNAVWEKELGNDDQVFWALAAMSAAEQNFPAPITAAANITGPGGAAALVNPPATWLELAVNTFNTQIARWDTASCAGGLRWQIYPTNNGWTYKNSISNGGLFQLAARLALHTGNATYSDWAARVWDWSVGVGAVDVANNYAIYDGAGVDQNCTRFDRTQWSYNAAMYLFGAAAMHNATGGAEPWAARAQGLLASATGLFFSASGVAYEPACEPIDTCNTDQLSFKAYLARWLAKTTVLAPGLAGIEAVMPKLRSSAMGAAAACSGGVDGFTCGYRWDLGGYDGKGGVGPQLAAMEVIQALLVGQAPAPAAAQGSGVHSSSSSSNNGTATYGAVSTPLHSTPVAGLPALPTTLLTVAVPPGVATAVVATPTTPAPVAAPTATQVAVASTNTATAMSRLISMIAAAVAKAQPADAMF